MEEHPIVMLVERERDVLLEIKDYFEQLVDKKFKYFGVSRGYAGENSYNVSFMFNAMDIRSVSLLVYVGKIYKRAATMQYNNIEEVILQCIREELAFEVDLIFDEMEGIKRDDIEYVEDGNSWDKLMFPQDD